MTVLIHNAADIAMPLFVGLLILWIPGLIIGTASGLPRALRWGWAPAGSVGLIATTAVIAPMVHLQWNVWIVAGATIAIATIIMGMRWAINIAQHTTARSIRSALPLHRKSQSFGDTPLATHFFTPDYPAIMQTGWFSPRIYRSLLIIALATASAAGFIKFFKATGNINNFIQHWDASYHLNAVQAIIQTGNGSSLNTILTNPTAPGRYPSGFHDVASLIILSSTGLSVPAATQLTALIFAFIVLPVGVATLAYVAFGRQIVTLIAGLVSLTFPAFPLTVLWWGPLYANLAAWAILPSTLALFAWAILSTRKSRRILPLLCVLGSLAGLTLAQPNAAVSWFIAAWVCVSWQVIAALLAAPSRTTQQFQRTQKKSLTSKLLRAFLIGLSWGILTSLAWLGLISILGFSSLARMNQRDPVGPVFEALGHGIGVMNALPYEPLTYAELIRVGPLSVLVVVGIIATLASKKSHWLFGVYLAWLTIFVAVYSSTTEWIRDYIGAFWYDDVPRVLAPLAMIAPILIGVAIDAMMSLARTAHLPILRIGSRIVAAGAISGLLVWAIQLPTWAASWQRLQYFSSQDPRTGAFLVDHDEYVLFEKMRTLLPADAVVIGNPWEGAAFSWAISGRRAAIPVLEFYESTRLYPYLSDHLSEGATNAQVCQELKKYNISYALDLADSPAPETTIYPGLRNSANGNLGPVIAQVGEAKLVKITHCG
ncbi:MAG: hypothetical protein MSC53_07700 [Arcanobacterium sp.]|nr:hypothetical protein [Arcanobacterium sp.]